MKKKSITFQLEHDLVSEIDRRALNQNISRAEVIRFLLKSALDNSEEKKLEAMLEIFKAFKENQSQMWRVLMGLKSGLERVGLETLIQTLVSRQIAELSFAAESRAASMQKLTANAESLARKILEK